VLPDSLLDFKGPTSIRGGREKGRGDKEKGTEGRKEERALPPNSTSNDAPDSPVQDHVGFYEKFAVNTPKWPSAARLPRQRHDDHHSSAQPSRVRCCNATVAPRSECKLI